MATDTSGPIAAAACPGLADFVVRTAQTVALGPVHVTIRSNEESFAELQYFPTATRFADCQPDYIINCCNLRVDGPWSVTALRDGRDGTYRAGRFAAGYYLTDHFGPPAYLLTRGKHLWIFAERFEPILWPYVVKWLLTDYALEHGLQQLKAAAVQFDDTVTLLVGRGGSGKTVLLTQLCKQAGARFLAN